MNMKTKKMIANRMWAWILSVLMVLSFVPMQVKAAEQQTVTANVIIENTTYAVADGAEWDGTLLEEAVTIPEGSSMMDAIAAAVDQYNAKGNAIEVTGIDSGYISDINGLGASGMAGWMGMLNDWLVNVGFSDTSIAVKNGDEIRIAYSQDCGEDLGASWANNDKSVKNVTISQGGSLDKEFDKTQFEYTVSVPSSVSGISVVPEASNKNFQVHTYLGTKEEGVEYGRRQVIPVKNGDVITVVCGDPSWPSMNNGIYGGAENVPAQTYTFHITKPEAIGTVHVIAENKTLSTEQGAVWTGSKLDTDVELYPDSNMIAVLTQAFEQEEVACTGLDTAYITDIDGLGLVDGNWNYGWYVLLNDWGIDQGINAFSVEAGNLKTDDVIRIAYTTSMGEDLGVVYGNTDKTVKSISTSEGTWNKKFQKDVTDYTVTIPKDVSSLVFVTEACNKAFQVHTYLGTKENGKEYQNGHSIPVKAGDTVTVVCGDPNWPSMNNGGSVKAEQVPAKTYTIHIKNPADKPQVVKVSGISLSKTNGYLVKGKSLTLKATVKPTNATNKNVSWKSSNIKIATVSSKGVVKAVGTGEVTITCTAKDGSKKKATCKLYIVADNTQAYVARLYKETMGRNPDKAGLAYWTKQIKSKKIKPGDVAIQFLNTPEFQNKKLSDTQYVKVLYRVYLNREAEQAGLNYWVKEVKKSNRNTVAKRMAGTDEFKKIVKSFGL